MELLRVNENIINRKKVIFYPYHSMLYHNTNYIPDDIKDILAKHPDEI